MPIFIDNPIFSPWYKKITNFIFFLQAMLEILLLFTMECSLPRRTAIMTSGPRTAHRLGRERGGTKIATIRT